MAPRLSSSAVSLELTKAGENLLQLPSSTKGIIKCLVQTENILSKIPSVSISIIKPLHVIREALISEDLTRHSNMDVKISVACCMCEIIRIMAPNTPYDDNQMKEFFELVVTVLEKVSSSSGESYTKMIKLIETLSSGEFVVMMCHLQLDGLIERIFRWFLRAADSNSSAVVSKMEKIMTMIIKESKELPRELVNLLAMSGKSNNEIASPVRVQLAKKVLKNYADKMIPDIVDMIQSVEHGENLVGSRIKVWWPEDNTYYEGTVNSFEPVKKKHEVWYDDGDDELLDLKTQKWELVDDVSPMFDCTVNPESEKKTLAIIETPMSSKSVTMVNGKRKKQIQSVEHGENLVGSRIKVWWPEDNTYYEGTVKSFDTRKKKHKVWYDDGNKELIDLKTEKWELVEDVSPMLDSIQSVEHGENLVGSRIKVWWPEDNTYYKGTVKSFDTCRKKYKVWYDDGDKETIDLKKEKWELVEDVSPMLDCAQSAEHGENLVGSKIKVWWPADKSYYEGVVESFDRSKMKHKVLYDDGDEDVLNLNERQWILLKDVSAIETASDFELALPSRILSPQALSIKGSSTEALPKKVLTTQTPPPKEGSSTQTLPIKNPSARAPPRMSTRAPHKMISATQAPTKKVSSTQAPPMNVSATQSGLKSVQGYEVKKSIAPILEDIIKKHGDVASDCVFKTPSVRASILEVICEVVRRIQTNDVADTISEMEEMQRQVSAAEANKINVGWLQQHLDAIQKRTETKEKCSLLMKGKPASVWSTELP